MVNGSERVAFAGRAALSPPSILQPRFWRQTTWSSFGLFLQSLMDYWPAAGPREELV